MKPYPLPKKDERMQTLIQSVPHKTLARWAQETMEYFLPYLDEHYPQEERPREAMRILTQWLNDEITMWEARKFCWKVLEFAREIEEKDKAGCQLVRACSHTLATCHVPSHCEGVTIYTLSYMQYAYHDQPDILEMMSKERERQIQRLIQQSEGTIAFPIK